MRASAPYRCYTSLFLKNGLNRYLVSYSVESKYIIRSSPPAAYILSRLPKVLLYSVELPVLSIRPSKEHPRHLTPRLSATIASADFSLYHDNAPAAVRHSRTIT